MRTFRDSGGDDWTVFEVRRHLSRSEREWSQLPSGLNSGWLCFENATAKRRLVKYPNRWREFSDAELEQLLGEAQPAPRMRWRLDDDSGDLSTSPDVRPE